MTLAYVIGVTANTKKKKKNNWQNIMVLSARSNSPKTIQSLKKKGFFFGSGSVFAVTP